MWSARQSLLALAFAVTGGAAWWLMEREPETEIPIVRPRAPDYVVSDFSAVETDAEGRPSRVLVADQLRQYVDEDLAELDSPHLKLYQRDGPPWEAGARHGLVLAGGEEIKLWADVTLSRAAGANTRPVHVATSELRVWPERQYAQGDRPVRIDSGRDWIDATGVKLWYETPARAEFPGRAHMFLAPQPQGEPGGSGSSAAGTAPDPSDPPRPVGTPLPPGPAR